MRYAPGQTAPQMPPRGPKGPVKKPIVAQQTTAAPVGRTKGGIGMTGGPKPKPTAQMAGANRAFQAEQQRAQRAATMPKPSKPAIGMSRPLNATGTPAGRPRAVNTGSMTPPPSTVVNPIRPGMMNKGGLVKKPKLEATTGIKKAGAKSKGKK